MASPVSTIRNLGAASDALYARAGLTSAEEVRALGADETYRRLLRAGSRPHFIAYYALVLGLQGRLWTDLPPAEKAMLRQRFDTLKQDQAMQPADRQKGHARLDAALDALGVIAPVDRTAPQARGRPQPTSSRPEKK